MSDRKQQMHDATMPSRSQVERPPLSRTTDNLDVPWLVRQFLNGDGDLHGEMAQRYPNQPLMSLCHVRTLAHGRGLASLSAQDGSASMSIEIDSASRSAHFAYTLASMLTLRFDLVQLTDGDRAQWLEHVQGDGDSLYILWGRQRWRSDYLIWSQRAHFTNVYAFSARQTEAAARLTPEVARAVIQWLRQYWAVQPQSSEALKDNW